MARKRRRKEEGFGSAVHKAPSCARAYKSFLLSSSRISRSSPLLCPPLPGRETSFSRCFVCECNCPLDIRHGGAAGTGTEREGEMAWGWLAEGVGGRRRRSCTEDKGQAANARVVWTPVRARCFLPQTLLPILVGIPSEARPRTVINTGKQHLKMKKQPRNSTRLKWHKSQRCIPCPHTGGQGK